MTSVREVGLSACGLENLDFAHLQPSPLTQILLKARNCAFVTLSFECCSMMVSNATSQATTGATDSDEWTFGNSPAAVLYFTKNILIFLARAIGVILSLLVVLTVCFLLGGVIVKAFTVMLSWWSRSKKASGDDGGIESVPLQDQRGRDEESAEQPLIGKGAEADAEAGTDEDSEQPPKYDGTSSCGSRNRRRP